MHKCSKTDHQIRKIRGIVLEVEKSVVGANRNMQVGRRLKRKIDLQSAKETDLCENACQVKMVVVKWGKTENFNTDMLQSFQHVQCSRMQKKGVQ